MYAGRLLEEAPVRDIYRQPKHPYTIGLFQCLPRYGERKDLHRLASLPGRVTLDSPGACPFEPRCRFQGGSGCRSSLAEQADRLARGLGLMEPGLEDHRAACDASAWLNSTLEEAGQVAGAGRAAPETLLEVHDLTSQYKIAHGLWGGRQTLRPVDGVSLNLERGRTLAVVGESGCGKSSLARALLGFNPVIGGRVVFQGQLLAPAFHHRPKSLTSQMTMVFQNPDSTLNPKHTVGYAISRPLELNTGAAGRPDLSREAARYLELVELDAHYAGRYPGELSGGQKQRVALARALVSRPSLVICDDPTSALDVSVQAAIINLLLDIQARLGVSYLFISHDLSVVRYLSDHLAIMYLGRFCETGPAEKIFAAPAHPYTRALFSAVAQPDPDARREPIRLAGSPPSLAAPPPGCRFNPRCRESLGVCQVQSPQPRLLGDGHLVYCHLHP